MTQVPEIQDEQRNLEDEAPASEPEAAAQEGRASEPVAFDPAPPEPEPEGRFGSLKEQSLNRWSVRDRDL